MSAIEFVSAAVDAIKAIGDAIAGVTAGTVSPEDARAALAHELEALKADDAAADAADAALPHKK